MQRRTTPAGDGAWKLDYRFSQRYIKGRSTTGIWSGDTADKIGWNHYFNPTYQWWEKVVTQDGDTVYDTTTFDALFQAEGAT